MSISEDEPVGCCCKKSGMEVFLCLALITVIITIPFGIYFFLKPEVNYCLEPECIKSSAEILSFIDTSVNPCENFEEFVCGNFKRTIYENEIEDPLSFESKRINNKLKAFIVQPPNKEEDSKAVLVQKQFFQACLNIDEINNDRDRTFFHLIHEIGGWPLKMPRAFDEKRFNWLQTIIKCRQIGLPFDWFMHFDVHTDGNGKNLLIITPPRNCNSVDDLKSNEYNNMMGNMVINITRQNDFFAGMRSIIQFEEELAKLCHLHKNDKMLRRHVRDLQQLVPNKGDPRRNWVYFLSVLTGRNSQLPLDTKILYNIQHYPKLDHLLQQTPKSVQANYIVWKMIEYFAPYLSTAFREPHMEYMKNKRGEEDTTRFQFCLDDTKSKFPFLSEVEYVKKYTSVETTENINEMIDLIRNQFVEYTESASWSDQDLKNSSLEFYSEDMERVIAGDDLSNTNFIEEQVEKLNFKGNNIIEMLVEKAQADSSLTFDRIGRVEENDIENRNVDLDIQMDFEQNKLFVSAGTLTDFFYNMNKQNYLNFAGLGALLAAKLTDFEKISENGTLTYEKCITNDLILSEDEVKNTAELVFGRDIAYSAYQKWVEMNGEETQLPGLDSYTPNQLFWIKSSLSYCYQHLVSEEETENNYNKFIQSLKHSKFFSEDFECALGSEMNPETKCSLN